jgi:tRNA-specific 2-thiouridylase
MEHKTIVVGMSGGVDSSVAALLLKRQGFNVIGAFMKNFSDTKNPLTGECAWKEEKRMAERIAAILGIPLVIFDFEKEYKSKVINPMFRDYKKGLTPNPDILCNKIIKFPLFWKKAKTLGADFIAMGHYARIKKTPDGFELLKGKDAQKDQSYFLCSLSQSDLSHTLFPLGNFTKAEVREIAKRNNLPNWNKQGTRGICFVGKIKIKPFLEKKIKNKKGRILSPEGNLLGCHPGVSYFTIGQKVQDSFGLIIQKPKQFAQKRYYIVEKRKPNTIIAAPENHPSLLKHEVMIHRFHKISPKEKIPHFGLTARIRHLGQLHKGALSKKSGKYVFRFAKPVKAVAEGQSIVIYFGNIVIGGGEIRL